MRSGRYTAGLLGNEILWPYRVHMDFRAGRLILEKRGNALSYSAASTSSRTD